MFEYELGRGSLAQPVHVATVKFRNLLLEPTGERILRGHEPSERLSRVYRLRVSQDHIPTGHTDEVDPHAADAQVPFKSLVFAETVIKKVRGNPPPPPPHTGKKGKTHDCNGHLGIPT